MGKISYKVKKPQSNTHNWGFYFKKSEPLFKTEINAIAIRGFVSTHHFHTNRFGWGEWGINNFSLHLKLLAWHDRLEG